MFVVTVKQNRSVILLFTNEKLLKLKRVTFKKTFLSNLKTRKEVLLIVSQILTRVLRLIENITRP